ncbi:FAD-dependent oxidoreductase [Paenibacillus sp. PAMC21692]|uniref:FAD-dependent oxidoreductase n=1 Tax=Paenibacillus sp. PAMC21692 TaxID=2762320 RepID=UPI00164E68B6|nr:FAD-dependent oxidoreductase [Paenibacillus sp. PAMC21692]QNK55646.1 FAD-dependent oxidoreductase [Paenibacillus sp. PAMC21692]
MEADNVMEAEVLVVGGGTAGCLAALAAAEEGAKVVLLESDSALGGVATRGGIHRYYYGSPGGLQDLIDRRTEEIAKLFGGRTMGFHPEAKRVALALLCSEHGVQVYLDSVVYQVLMEKNDVVGVLALAPSGPLRIQAHTTIDCTGNGSLARMAGAKLQYGRDLDGVYHNYSLIPRRLRDGQIGYDNLDAGWVDPYDPWDVSRAFTRGREWIREGYSQGHRYFGISSMLGVREGGRIVGDSTISIRDYIEDVPSEDIISRSYSHLDNHGFDTGNESEFSQLWIAVLGLFVKGLWCDIPYGSLLPQGIGSLLVGGRSLSADRDVSMGVRMQKDMHKVGEAAGVAAALSARKDCLPRDLDIGMLQKRLVARHVIEVEDLQRTAGRNLAFRHGALAGLRESDAASYGASDLVPYLETEERWKAIWLLSRLGGDERELAVAMLADKLEAGAREVRFCAAVVLAMLGSDAAVPYLLRVIAEKSPDKLSNHHKCVPFWIASFVLLRMLRSPAGVGEALGALQHNGISSAYATFLLDYLSVVTPSLPEADQSEVSATLQAWSEDPRLGSDYLMHGERLESLQWSLKLRAEAIVTACGGEPGSGTDVIGEAHEPRAYVRGAASRLLPKAGKPENEGDEGPERGGGDASLGRFDAAVIGGTVAGVVCAAELSRRGYSVVLVERSASLLTELTRSRQTCFMPSSAPQAGQPDENPLMRSLLEEGAIAGGELEPVLAQLAADRLLEESGANVLYEARVLETSESSAEEGRGAILRIVHKNGTGYLEASRVYVMDDENVQSGSPACDNRRVLTATLLGVRIEQEISLAAQGEAGELELRLRPSFYAGEAYLDIGWRPSEPASGGEEAAAVVVAMRELRASGVISEEAALAYLADVPRSSATDPSGSVAMERDYAEQDWFRRQLDAGIRTARIGK